MLAVGQHHKYAGVCLDRPEYRKGNRPTAVKTYTINSESKYLLVQHVHCVNGTGVVQGLLQRFAQFGPVRNFMALPDYPSMQFEQAFLVVYQRLQSARIAKRKLDEFNHLGKLLHVCYAPEYETLDEVREKLAIRRREVARQLRQYTEEKNGIASIAPHSPPKKQRRVDSTFTSDALAAIDQCRVLQNGPTTSSVSAPYVAVPVVVQNMVSSSTELATDPETHTVRSQQVTNLNVAAIAPATDGLYQPRRPPIRFIPRQINLKMSVE